MKVNRVAWTTGEDSINSTRTRASVGGTDLGILWDDGRGGILSIWGDTFADNVSPLGTGADWRSNVLARSTNTDYKERGLIWNWWNTDTVNHARQIIPRDKPSDFTIIPTSGISIATRQYVTYMSIHDWVEGVDGVWHTNYAGFAYSDDGGVTWIKDANARWYNDTNTWGQFAQMCAMARVGDGYLYMLVTPNGRAGAAKLVRVPETAVLDVSKHQQYTGSDWTTDQALAVTVIPAPVSELSVMYHNPSKQWLAGYYHQDLKAMVVRTAPAITGPWSDVNLVATSQDYPRMYGFFWHTWSANDTNPCAHMSQWPPYETELMVLTDLMG
jgi:hypothetical protein